jgi:hypothetical protein
MKVTLINHSSLLLKFKKSIILTDFWNTSPAFGSWLPSALPFYHPTYLASLSFEDNFYLTISHAHDDHIDDYFLKKYFNKKMKIIINEFPSPALKKRLNKLGFENIILITKNEKVSFEDFEAISIFDESVSNDDAGISFRNDKYCIYHGNDNWFKLKQDNLNKLKFFSKNRRFLYCSQTNSASGHPITYPQYKKNMRELLKNKIKKMLVSGLQNVEDLNADYFLPYAGFSKSYVKNKNYNLSAFDPTFKNLKELISNEKIVSIDKMINIFPGGTIDLSSGNVEYPFNFKPERLIDITNDYLVNENYIKKCDTYNEEFNNEEINVKNIENYLTEFCKFVYDYLNRFPSFYPSIKNKKICFEVFSNSNKEQKTLNIENQKILNNDDCNKKFIIPTNLFNAMYEKKIVFENLYTGYESEVMRFPLDEYNRDIIMYLDMFGYKYKNAQK